jgi:septal ring factor EnvC (AmiA/AmiB activator)
VETLDNELRDLLMKLLEGENRLETTVTRLEATVTGLESEVKKNSVKLEDIEKKINIIVEVHTSAKEQNERGLKRMLQEQDNTNTLITSSLKTVSDDVVEVKKDIKELNGKFDKVEKVTIQNTYDLAYLKSVK